MRILIPLAPSTEPHPDTLASIARQTVPCEVVTRSLPYQDFCPNRRLLRKRINECDNRNALMPEASAPYCAMLNHDVVLSSDHDVADCVEFLDAHPEYNIVALDTKHSRNLKKAEERKHVVNACIIFRIDALVGFQWTASEDKCSCLCMNETFRVRYLDNRHLKEMDK